MGIMEVKSTIRKAVETPLKTVCDTQAPPIPVKWPNLVFDSKARPEYIDVAHSFGSVTPLELGTNPRWQGIGAMSLVIRTPTASSLDRNDAIAGIIASAYPYGVDLIRDGLRVVIDKIDCDGYGMDGAWLFSNLNVHWIVYRRS